MIRVWKYDVWGNQKDGFEVNDRYEIGSYRNHDDIFSVPDYDIISFLKEEGFLTKGTHLQSFNIEGDGEGYLTIDYKNCPIMEITLDFKEGGKSNG
jgi:hypothetical protein